jgi:hypothetical protein
VPEGFFMKIGKWIVGKVGNGWSYPGKVTCLIEDTVIFKVLDFNQEPYEIHRNINDVREAGKRDFDRVISDANNALLKIEMFIDEVYSLQKEVM